jgi:hypothetical protein
MKIGCENIIVGKEIVRRHSGQLQQQDEEASGLGGMFDKCYEA